MLIALCTAFLSIYSMVKTDSLKGIPVPRADMLDDVLSSFMNDTDNTGSLMNYLAGGLGLGDPDNLDISILDADNAFKTIRKIKNQYFKNARRTLREGLKEYNVDMIDQAMDIMKQSIYGTRFRMQETARFRKYYTNDIHYHVGIFYGALMQISFKLETLYTSMKKLRVYTHFIWYVLLYEKELAAYVDIHNMVDRLFALEDSYNKIGTDPKLPIRLQVAFRPPYPTDLVTRGTIRRKRTRAVFTTLEDFVYTPAVGMSEGVSDDQEEREASTTTEPTTETEESSTLPPATRPKNLTTPIYFSTDDPGAWTPKDPKQFTPLWMLNATTTTTEEPEPIQVQNETNTAEIQPAPPRPINRAAPYSAKPRENMKRQWGPAKVRGRRTYISSFEASESGELHDSRRNLRYSKSSRRKFLPITLYERSKRTRKEPRAQPSRSRTKGKDRASKVNPTYGNNERNRPKKSRRRISADRN